VLFVSAAIATAFAMAKFVEQGGAFPVRVRGAAGHPLTYGGQAMLLCAIAGSVLLRARSRRWRLMAGALLVLLLPALLGSYTRSAWIGTLVAFTVILAATRARWLLGLAAVVALLLVIGPPAYRDRALSAFNPNSVWNVERVLLWTAGWRMFQEHPITGVGLQDLHPLIERYRPPGAHEQHGHLHSIYVQIAATMGLIGIAAFGWLAWGLFETAGRGLKAALTRPPPEADGLGHALRVAAVAALSGFLVAGLFEWNFGDEELLDFLFTLIGLACGASGWSAATDSEKVALPERAPGVPS
jgi:O-antigen ligase